jgi:hypothetical protein
MSPINADNVFQSLSVIGPVHALNERLPPAHTATAANSAARMSTYLGLEEDPVFALAAATV